MRNLREAGEPLLKFRQKRFYSLCGDGIKRSQDSPALSDFGLNVFLFRHALPAGVGGSTNSLSPVLAEFRAVMREYSVMYSA
jgi:hypothetical protein